jgi:hypothetical protein
MQIDSSQSQTNSSVAESDKAKRRGSFGFKALLDNGDMHNQHDNIAQATRSSSNSSGRDDFFEKLKDDGRTSFFGDHDDELPFVVHQSELTGVLVAPRFAGLSTVAVPKEIEVS